MNKKFVSTILVGILAVAALTGCGSTKKEDVTELKVWAMGEEGKLLPEIAKKFEEEHKNIKVDVQALPWGSAHDKLLAAVASGNGPDVLQMGTSWVPEFAEAGVLLDLSSYVEKHPNLAQENFFDSSLEAAVYDDKYVGVPWYVDTRVLYYRTDLLEEVGYPEGPSTWDELKDAATKLASRGEGLYGMDLDGKDQFFAMTFAWQNGSKIIEDRKPLFNEPEFTGAVKYLKSFFDEGLVPKQDDMDIVQAFKEGIKPMYISGPWMVNIMNNQAPEIKGKWAVRTLPAKETNTSFVGGSDLTVFHNSKNVDEALEFISYMTKQETQLEWLNIAKCLPSAKAAWEDSSLADDPMYKVFGEQMNTAKTSPFIQEWEMIAQEVNHAFEKINLGGADIQEELNKLNEKANKLLGN